MEKSASSFVRQPFKYSLPALFPEQGMHPNVYMVPLPLEFQTPQLWWSVLSYSHQAPLVEFSPKWYFLGECSRCSMTGRIRTWVLEAVTGQQASIAVRGSALLKRAVCPNVCVPRASRVWPRTRRPRACNGSHFTMSSAGQFLEVLYGKDAVGSCREYLLRSHAVCCEVTGAVRRKNWHSHAAFYFFMGNSFFFFFCDTQFLVDTQCYVCFRCAT